MSKSVNAEEIITSKIMLIRGQKVMLDRDLAELYGVSTKVLNQAVARNRERFPDDFMFQLTALECESLRSQNVTLKRGQHSKYFPHAFTELGVAMLSSVLRSKRAVEVNISIMRVFVRLRRVISENKELIDRINKLEQKFGKHDQEIQVIFDLIRRLMSVPEQPQKKIGF